MAEIVRRRMTAAAPEEFVVFIIGMRINKLWKVHKWLPVFFAMPRMLKELAADPDSGFLGAEQFPSIPRPVLVQYWRSFDELERYARAKDREHYPAWVAFNKRVASNGDVGIWHETYKVSAGSYECIYNNMPAFGLAKATAAVPVGSASESAAGRIAQPPSAARNAP